MNLNDIAKRCLEISNKRLKNGSSMTKDNLKHCAEEVIESVQAKEEWQHQEYLSNYSYVSDEDKNFYKDSFADELMDVIVCVLIECANNNIDVENALIKCMDKNKKRALCIGDKL